MRAETGRFEGREGTDLRLTMSPSLMYSLAAAATLVGVRRLRRPICKLLGKYGCMEPWMTRLVVGSPNPSSVRACQSLP